MLNTGWQRSPPTPRTPFPLCDAANQQTRPPARFPSHPTEPYIPQQARAATVAAAVQFNAVYQPQRHCDGGHLGGAADNRFPLGVMIPLLRTVSLVVGLGLTVAPSFPLIQFS